METLNRLCLECGKSLKGRSDKKFCDDYCRNAYNNKAKIEESFYVRNINKTLQRNRRILEELLGKEDMVKQTKSNLINKGFQFHYHTHQYVNKKGNVYYFCYEYGFLPLEGEWYLIVKRKEPINNQEI
jgi:hypothetical protein